MTSAQLLDCSLLRSAVLRTVLPLLLSLGLPPTVLASDVTFFETRIRPVLARSCFKCHSAKSRKPKGELLLDSRDSVLKGGETGPAVVPGNLEVSLLVRAVRYEDEDLQMPPSGKLPDEVIADFERWVRDGAPFPSAAKQPPTGTPWWEEIDPLRLLAAETPISEAVDHYVELRLEREGVRKAALASDAQFLRRLSLDLVGRVPTLREVSEYVAPSDISDPPESERPSESAGARRAALVNRLIASAGFVRQQVSEFDFLLMDESGRTTLAEYLLTAFETNSSWGRIFRELLKADPSAAETRGSDAFIKSRVGDLDRLTNDVSIRFFGVNISCARCHDHPEVPEWTQHHYFGMKSFFSRTFKNGDFIGERDYGLVSFKTTQGKSHRAKLRFLSGAPIPEPETKEPNGKERNAEKKRLQEYAKKKQPPPPPKFSRRDRLIDAGLGADGSYWLARSLINRLWYRLFGHGLVMPLDQLHGENLPSHPKLLQWLARDFVDHGYDIRRLIRGLVASRTYSRASYWPGDDRPAAHLFAVAAVRPLTPRQYAISLRLAGANPGHFDLDDAVELEKRLTSIEERARGMIGWFEPPRESFQIGVNEALLLSNSKEVRDKLLRDDGLLRAILETQGTSKQVDLLVRAVLGRPPHAEEERWLTAYIEAREERAADAWRQVLWSLLTSSEFRFNH